MFLHAKTGSLRLRDGCMDYIRFGNGEKILVMLPGLGDSLRPLRGLSLPIALFYRRFVKQYTVYSFSRKRPLQEGCTIADLASDQIEAMDLLGIHRADLMGISMGGMIAQQLDIRYPNRIGKLVLVVTCAEPNPLLIESVNEWMDYARRNDHAAFWESNLRRIYSEAFCRRTRRLLPLLSRFLHPRSYDRFLIQAQACLKHDDLAQLARISAQTLVIGGEMDAALGSAPSQAIADAIPKAELKLYPRGRHGLYYEEKDFKPCVLNFLVKP